MKRITCFILVLSLCSLLPALAATVYIPDDYPNILSGVLASGDGDSVIVRDGVYTGSGNRGIYFQGYAITLMSENGPTNCIIDAEGLNRVFCFDSGEPPEALVQGFTVANGHLTDYGGCIYISGSSPTIRNCIITGGNAYYGGGICCRSGSASLIEECAVIDNSVGIRGGGIYINSDCDITIRNSIISYNSIPTG